MKPGANEPVTIAIGRTRWRAERSEHGKCAGLNARVSGQTAALTSPGALPGLRGSAVGIAWAVRAPYDPGVVYEIACATTAYEQENRQYAHEGPELQKPCPHRGPVSVRFQGAIRWIDPTRVGTIPEVSAKESRAHHRQRAFDCASPATQPFGQWTSSFPQMKFDGRMCCSPSAIANTSLCGCRLMD